MRKKSRYPEGDYSRRRKQREMVIRVAVAIEPTSGNHVGEDGALRFAFHGATQRMLTHVFRTLQKGGLFADYVITESTQMPMVNGRSYRTLTVEVARPDLQRLSKGEWPQLIAHLMQSTWRCRVTCFDRYQKFLNN